MELEVELAEPDLMTFAINRCWPEIDMEWFVVPAIAANDETPDSAGADHAGSGK